MKIFGVSILAASVIFLVGYLVAKQYPQLLSMVPVLNKVGS